MDCINIIYREIKQKKLPYFCGVKGGWFCSTFAWTWEWRTAGSDSLIGFDLGGDRDGLRLVIGLHGEWRRPTRAGHIPRVFLICHRTNLGLHPHHLRLGSLTVKNHSIRMAAQSCDNYILILYDMKIIYKYFGETKLMDDMTDVLDIALTQGPVGPQWMELFLCHCRQIDRSFRPAPAQSHAKNNTATVNWVKI